ncbi:MAG: hypothetical protein WC637_20265, partial [Victivallales bacterium]
FGVGEGFLGAGEAFLTTFLTMAFADDLTGFLVATANFFTGDAFLTLALILDATEAFFTGLAFATAFFLDLDFMAIGSPSVLDKEIIILNLEP